jgi:hypothetical protein
MRTRKNLLATAMAAAVVFVVGAAAAQTAKFVSKYKGQLFVSDQEFAVTDDDAAMAAQIKKNARKELEGKDGAEGKEWSFHWLAVLSKKTSSANVTMFFYETNKAHKQVTYKDLGIDANQQVIVADMNISEDDGLKKDTKYELVLASTDGGKQTVLAKTQVLFK